MKSHILFIVLFFFTLNQTSAQEGFKQNLAHLISINFPSKPDASDTLGQQVFHYADADASYLVVAMDLSKKQNFELKSGDLDEFYKGNVKGVLDAAKGKLISEKPFEIEGLKGLDIVYKSSSNPLLPDLRFKRILFLNGIMLSIDFWTLSENELKTKPERDKFFNSITIIADKASLQQGTSGVESAAYDIGFVIGSVAAWLVIPGIVLIIILMVRRKRKKKRMTAIMPE